MEASVDTDLILRDFQWQYSSRIVSEQCGPHALADVMNSDIVVRRSQVSDLPTMAIVPRAQSAEISSEIARKFHRYAPLVPWLHPLMLDWDGQWLVRMIHPQAATLIVDGIKPCEITAFSDVVTWGVQGYIITAIYHGAGNMDISSYLPEPHNVSKYDPALKGKITGIVILSPPSSPCLTTDVGWYTNVSPKGAPAVMLRVISVWKCPHPITPR